MFKFLFVLIFQLVIAKRVVPSYCRNVQFNDTNSYSIIAEMQMLSYGTNETMFEINSIVKISNVVLDFFRHFIYILRKLRDEFETQVLFTVLYNQAIQEHFRCLNQHVACNYSKAVDHLDQLLGSLQSIHKDNMIRSEVAASLRLIGLSHYALREYSKASKSFDEYFRVIGELQRERNNDEVTNIVEKMLDIQEKLGDRSKYLKFYIKLIKLKWDKENQNV